MTVGVADQDRIFYSAASGIGNPIVYVGSKTGRDGIHGATMASADFGEDADAKRPTVQVGDPFTEKLLIEACLELMATDVIVAIQDMGAAGLTSSSVEMASKGGVGIELVMDDVPQRETGMTPYEMMLSESQERMLMVLKPGREAEAEAIFRKWELDFAVIGRVTDTGRMVLTFKGETVCDIPLGPLADEAPAYDRPWVATPPAKALVDVPDCTDLAADLLTLMGSPDIASRRWIWEQYDTSVGGDTVQKPGGDAAIVRVHGTAKGLAVSTDCTPRYCFANPIEGGKQAIAECWRNLTAVGATPDRRDRLHEFRQPAAARDHGAVRRVHRGHSGSLPRARLPDRERAMSASITRARPLGGGSAILPTPAIGGVGLLADWRRSATIAFKDKGDIIVLVGARRGDLGQSLWLRECHKREDGPPPRVDLAAERADRRLCPQGDRAGLDHRLPRRVRRRAGGDAGRDGAGREYRRDDRRARAVRSGGVLLRRRSGAVCRDAARSCPARLPRRGAGGERHGRADRADGGHAADLRACRGAIIA